MNDMVEQVAKAIWNHRFPDMSWESKSRSEGIKADYRMNARAAIAAMREPSEKMIEAGIHAPPIPTMRAFRAHYSAAWQAMIDEALKP